jgi:hypothetical protein
MSKKKFFRKTIEQVPSSCQNVKSKAERRMEELKKDHFSENDNDISIQLEISKKDIEQTIFDTLEDIYEDKSPSSQILRLRSLLEYSFAFSLGYIEKFEPHTEYWPLSSLADNYCKSISNKNKYSTTGMSKINIYDNLSPISKTDEVKTNKNNKITPDAINIQNTFFLLLFITITLHILSINNIIVMLIYRWFFLNFKTENSNFICENIYK